MKNSLSEIKDLPITVGNVLVTGLLSKQKEIYTVIDLKTNTVIFLQPPKGTVLRIGKIYAVLGRLANLSINDKNNLMIYVYTITKSRISHMKDLKVYIPASHISLSEHQLPQVETKHKVRQYRNLIVSTKESETISILLDCPNPSTDSDYVEFDFGPDKLKSYGTSSTLNLTSTPRTASYGSLKWICKKFNIGLN